MHHRDLSQFHKIISWEAQVAQAVKAIFEAENLERWSRQWTRALQHLALRQVDADDPDAFNHCFAEVNGIRMHYIDEGQGPLVILLHGFPYLWYMWRRQIVALAEAGFGSSSLINVDSGGPISQIPLTPTT